MSLGIQRHSSEYDKTTRIWRSQVCEGKWSTIRRNPWLLIMPNLVVLRQMVRQYIEGTYKLCPLNPSLVVRGCWNCNRFVLHLTRPRPRSFSNVVLKTEVFKRPSLKFWWLKFCSGSCRLESSLRHWWISFKSVNTTHKKTSIALSSPLTRIVIKKLTDNATAERHESTNTAAGRKAMTSRAIVYCTANYTCSWKTSPDHIDLCVHKQRWHEVALRLSRHFGL